MAKVHTVARGTVTPVAIVASPVVTIAQTKLQKRNAPLIAAVQAQRAAKNAIRRQRAHEQSYQMALEQLHRVHLAQVQQLQAEYNIAPQQSAPRATPSPKLNADGQPTHAPGSRKAIHALCKGPLAGMSKADAVKQLIEVHGFASHTAKLYWIA